MSVILYDRLATLTVQEVTLTGAGSNIVVTVNPAFLPGFDPIAPLRIKFSIDKNIEPEPNRARIELYNLNADHRAALKKEYLVTLRAGYRGDLGSPPGELATSLPIIFKGNLTNVIQAYTGVDWVTTLTSGDGKTATKKGKMNDLVPRDTSVKEVFDRIKKRIEELGVEVMSNFSESILHWIMNQFQRGSSTPAGEGTSGVASTLGAPKALVGPIDEILTQETAKLNLSWSVQNNVLIVRPKGGSDAQPAIILSPSTGLVGSPERTENGVSGKALMISGLEPGRAVDIQSRIITGRFVITKATIAGDTHGADWGIDWEAMPEGAKIELPSEGA